MSALERRMQILLDEERYRHLEREARESGRSVASIVREAIDMRFASTHARRAEAGQRLMAEFTNHDADEPDWSETKTGLEQDIDEKLP